MTWSVMNKRWTHDHNQASQALLERSDERITQQLEKIYPKVGLQTLCTASGYLELHTCPGSFLVLS